jgi:hypothetical protein
MDLILLIEMLQHENPINIQLCKIGGAAGSVFNVFKN